MPTQLTNFATDTLNGAINNSTTSVVVNTGSLFPSSGDFTVLVDSELMLCTARSTNTLTVVRGQEGTTAASHSNGAVIKLVLSKAALENFFGERISMGGYASRPSTPRNGYLYYANDVDLGWQYDGGNWNLIHPMFVPYSKRVDLTGWSNANLGTSTWTNYNGAYNVAAPTSSGDNHRIYYKALPSAPYTLNAILRNPNVSQQFTGHGIGLYDGTKLFTITDFQDNTGQTVSVDRYNSVTSFLANNYRQQHWQGGYLWVKIIDDNTNWKFEFSQDGNTYNTVYSVARNTHLTATNVCLTVDRTETTYSDVVNFMFLGYWQT